MKSLFENGKSELFHDLFTQESEESKSALISVLNTVLAGEEDPIVEIKLISSVLSEKREAGTILDFDARSSKGEWSEIEVLFGKPEFYRAWLRECSSHHVKMALQSRGASDSKPYISVAFVNGILWPGTERIHMEFQYRESELGIPLSDHMKYHVIELGKVMAAKNVSDMSEVEQLIKALVENQ